MSTRYVMLGVARARTSWFTDVASWCTSGAIPAQFVKCVSVAEVRTRLESGRQFSALLIDGRLDTLDRDLIEAARSRGCAVLVVIDPTNPLDVTGLGASGRLSPTFDRGELLDALASHGSLIADTTTLPSDPVAMPQPAPWSGRLIGVCGTGGVGASTVSAALAQGLAADPRNSGLIVLADLALHADQAMLHGTEDVMPGLPELIDASRHHHVTSENVQQLTFSVPQRAYRLLLGLRRHRDWAALRLMALQTALLALRQTFQITVADIDADVEGDQQCGSTDIEDRNMLARTVSGQADLMVVVGGPGLKGTHALTRTIGELIESGVEPNRMVPIVNQAPRGAPGRSEMTRAISSLTPQLALPPIFLPDRRGIDEIHRDGAPFPKAIVGPLTGAVRLAVDRSHGIDDVSDGPERVKPGSLGSWADQGSAAQ